MLDHLIVQRPVDGAGHDFLGVVSQIDTEPVTRFLDPLCVADLVTEYCENDLDHSEVEAFTYGFGLITNSNQNDFKILDL